MPSVTKELPHVSQQLFLTDGGLETSLIFLEGEDLPLFAAHTLMRTKAGRAKLQDYYRPYAGLAVSNSAGFILESPTWRANPDWATQLGYSETALDEVNKEAIRMMQELAAEYQTDRSPFLISGCIGPRGDGYQVQKAMSIGEARRYHSRQIRVLADSGADVISALTMTSTEEAAGIAQAAKEMDIPSVISFTVETDGCLPSGADLGDAIQAVDQETAGSPAYYMINCAHPTHFAKVLAEGGEWVKRICGIRANASALSHAELDAAEELDAGDMHDLARRYGGILQAMPWVRVVGGCCGTDHNHISAICQSCLPENAA